MTITFESSCHLRWDLLLRVDLVGPLLACMKNLRAITCAPSHWPDATYARCPTSGRAHSSEIASASDLVATQYIHTRLSSQQRDGRREKNTSIYVKCMGTLQGLGRI